MENKEKWRELCGQLDYLFRDMRLLFEALRHPSWIVNKESSGLKSYQRLEFLGDRVVNLIAAERLFKMFPEASEGELTGYLALVVNNSRLADVAKRFNLSKYLSMSKGAEAEELRHNEYILACTLEALFGAIFIDSGGGYLKVRQLLNRHLLLDQEIKAVIETRRDFDPKSWLQELAQQKFKGTPDYKVVAREQETDNYVVSVVINDVEFKGYGKGKNKKKAEKQAASRILRETRDLTSNLPFALLKQMDPFTLGETAWKDFGTRKSSLRP